MNFVSRLNLVISHLSITSSQFADAINLPRPSLSQILNGRNKKISNEVIEKIHTAFPSINISWLLFGEGNMTSESINSSNENLRNEISRKNSESDLESTNQNIFSFTYDENNVDLAQENITGTNPHQESSTIEKKHSMFSKITIQNAQEISNKKPIPTKNEFRPNEENDKLDQMKEIVKILVLYSDNTYKVFRPSEL